jgi:hypothetical protein
VVAAAGRAVPAPGRRPCPSRSRRRGSALGYRRRDAGHEGVSRRARGRLCGSQMASSPDGSAARLRRPERGGSARRVSRPRVRAHRRDRSPGFHRSRTGAFGQTGCAHGHARPGESDIETCPRGDHLADQVHHTCRPRQGGRVRALAGVCRILAARGVRRDARRYPGRENTHRAVRPIRSDRTGLARRGNHQAGGRDVRPASAADPGALHPSSGDHDQRRNHRWAHRPIPAGGKAIRRVCECVAAGQHGARERPRRLRRRGQGRTVAGDIAVRAPDRHHGRPDPGQRVGRHTAAG